MKTENKIKGIAAGITILFFMSLVTTVYFYNQNNSLSDFLADAKLASEKLLSEKLSLDKSIAALKRELTDSKGKSSTLDKQIAGMQKTLSEKEARINQLNKRENSFAQLKKENVEIQNMRSSLASRVDELTTRNNQLAMENNQLNSKLNSVESENSKMLAELSILRSFRDGPESFMVEIIKGKAEKLTVKASKTKKINVSFDVPEEIKGIPSMYTIDILGETGKKLEGVANITTNNIRSGAVASINGTPQVGRQRVNIEFLPKEKLGKGVYTFNIYRNGELVARTKARLSK